ncbi:Auxin Efflux Carrier family protein [Tritrichomonas foetus]|uniref:Auxin Efflux Carrier family protein n=1 Tax=Tritrichomonas foetus TaxID=1144522 RepID=A0A1J4K9Q4_9EUKA|nr:Auxin Efflux Carrier family protein [Tritrichomonas foetus]|eukprot:OHT06173.1 Auxin Efflux Carrier family protein [Tritrichomonas foetus]
MRPCIKFRGKTIEHLLFVKHFNINGVFFEKAYSNLFFEKKRHSMTDFSNVIQVGVSMLLIVILGFTLTKLNIIPKCESDLINKFSARICFFALTFRSLAGNNIREMNFMPLAVGGLLVIIGYIICLPMLLIPMKSRFATYISTTFPTIYVNYVISGIPIFESMWDPAEATVIPIIFLSNDLIASPIFFILANVNEIMIENRRLVAEGKPKRKFSFRTIIQIILNMCQNMFLIGNIFGLIYASTAWKVCTFVREAMKLLGDCVLAFSLFCVGAFLSQHSLISCHWSQFVFAMIMKLIIAPLIMCLLCAAFKLPSRLARQCIILSGQPTAASCFAITDTAKLGTGVSSTMIFWSTFGFIPLLVLWVYVLDTLHLFPDN